MNNQEKTTKIQINLTVNGFQYFTRDKKFTKKNEIVYKCLNQSTCKDVRVFINEINLTKIINNEPNFNYFISGYHRCRLVNEVNHRN